MSNQQTSLLLGGPGTGKTATLINTVSRALDQGIDHSRIAFVSFTKAAAVEAGNRASREFDIDAHELKWFCTIHSLCYRSVGISRGEVMDRYDWQDITEALGIEVTGNRGKGDEMPGAGMQEGDRALSLISYAQSVRQPLETVWRAFGEDLDYRRLKQIDDTIARYKGDTGKVDFPDMLSLFLRRGIPPLALDLAIIDEAQDLTPAQWAVVRVAFQDTPRVVIGGDDDQAIYEWAGADIKTLLNLDVPREILPLSHRLPRKIFDLAEQISGRLSKRYAKNWKPGDRDGSVEVATDVSFVNFREDTSVSWLVLARNGYTLKQAREELRRQGVPFHVRGQPSVEPDHVRAIIAWERRRKGIELSDELSAVVDVYKGHRLSTSAPWYEALTGIGLDTLEYYRDIVRNGYKLHEPPKVSVNTIHGAKGQEADNVVLFADVSHRTMQGYEMNPDAEHRVFYVGATRAKNRLIIVEPQTDIFYRIIRH